MKTFSGTFANGHKYMGVEGEGYEREVYKKNCPNGFYYLGIYHTEGKIYFRVSDEWVHAHPIQGRLYTSSDKQNAIN